MNQDQQLNKQDTEAVILLLLIEFKVNKNKISEYQVLNRLKKKQIKSFQREYNNIVHMYKVGFKGKEGLDVIAAGILSFITDNGPINDVKISMYNQMDKLRKSILENTGKINNLEKTNKILRQRISKNIIRHREMYSKEVNK